LDTHGFDRFVEDLCRPFYADGIGRPGLPPGRYFRLLLIGYFEGLDSERGIAWRAEDSLALRSFLRIPVGEAPPDHTTISRTRRLIDLETHRAVFIWILQVLATADLVKGKTLGIDATTLEANAALRSIVRRDSGETYQEFLTRLAQASGIDTPTRADLARLDRNRPKKGRNSEWRHPHDPDARITKMKDGRTHLAHKAEHAVDLDTGAIVGITVQGADRGDTTTIAETVTAAAEVLEDVAIVTDDHTRVVEEVVADKGYHSNQVLTDLATLDLRTYIAEPDRGRRRWRGQTTTPAAAQRAPGTAERAPL
jgi:transposase